MKAFEHREVVFSNHANQRLAERLDSSMAKERIIKQVLFAYQHNLYSATPPSWISQKLHGPGRTFVQMRLDKEAPVCVIIANENGGENPPLVIVTIITNDKYKEQKPLSRNNLSRTKNDFKFHLLPA